MQKSDDVSIGLRSHEALIFYDWLSSLEMKGDMTVPDEATQRILWKIEGIMEKSLVAVFDPDYKNLLSAAKDKCLTEVSG